MRYAASMTSLRMHDVWHVSLPLAWATGLFLVGTCRTKFGIKQDVFDSVHDFRKLSNNARQTVLRGTASLSARVGEYWRTSSKPTSCQTGRMTFLPPISRVANASIPSPASASQEMFAEDNNSESRMSQSLIN